MENGCGRTEKVQATNPLVASTCYGYLEYRLPVAPPSMAHRSRTRATPALAPAVPRIGRVKHGGRPRPSTGKSVGGRNAQSMRITSPYPPRSYFSDRLPEGPPLLRVESETRGSVMSTRPITLPPLPPAPNPSPPLLLHPPWRLTSIVPPAITRGPG